MENKQNLSGLRKEDFQQEVSGKAVDLYFLTNENGLEVAITNYGGAIVSIMTPDNKSNFAKLLELGSTFFEYARGPLRQPYS